MAWNPEGWIPGGWQPPGWQPGLDSSSPTPPPVLSLPTPSGLLPTALSATIGAHTDQAAGTFYVVVDSAANLAGVTAPQIKLGRKANNTAALAAGNSAAVALLLAAGVIGLSELTLYSYAAVQNNPNGDSNIVTGTFTTNSIIAELPAYRRLYDVGRLRIIELPEYP